MASGSHHCRTMSFSARAAIPSCPPLNAYLLHIMSIKRTNLCLSADVTTSSELLAIADELGDSICLLKTHADIISDWSDRTVRQLREIAARRHFLIFEDRKFADIGSTVQKQYAAGPLSIAKWAELVTVHVLPGPAIVSALKQAAVAAISSYNTTVHTEISSGDWTAEDSDSPTDTPFPDAGSSRFTPTRARDFDNEENLDVGSPYTHMSAREPRKQSIVSISTTISTRSEPMSPQPTKPPFGSVPGPTDGSSNLNEAFSRLGPVPYLRSCLLLAQMSSKGNLLTESYTQACMDIARANADFVLGLISQVSLNSKVDDNFLTLTPGVKLLEGKDAETDNLGQQYRTPRDVVLNDGTDIIIVGRGILNHKDRLAIAERYRAEAWGAYESRIAASP